MQKNWDAINIDKQLTENGTGPNEKNMMIQNQQLL